MKKAGGAGEPPDVEVVFWVLAGAFCRRVRPGPSFRHRGFHGLEVEARAPLHRRVIEEGLEFLAHHLLDKHKTPELELEPVEVLLSTFFCPIVRPTLALKRIETQVYQVRHVNVRLFTEPATGLVNEAKLIVVKTHRADG